MSSPQPISYMQYARTQLAKTTSIPARAAPHRSTSAGCNPCSSSPASSSFTDLYLGHKASRSAQQSVVTPSLGSTVHEAVQHPQHAAVFGAVALAMSTLGAAGVTLSKALWEAMHPPGYFAKDKESTILYGVEIPEASLLHQPALQRVIQFAALAHQGQRRKSGHLYVVHCIETALIVEKLLSPKESVQRRTHAIMAAILHDVIDDTSFSLSMVSQSFGEAVATLVDTVTQISQLNQLMRRYKRNLLLKECKATEQQLRNLLLDSVDDPLVLLIKLADRLHNMRTVHVLQPLKRAALAKETLNVWCPLAERLGLFPLKAELEDLCFAVLHPEDYADIRTQLDKLWQLDASVRLQLPNDAAPISSSSSTHPSGAPRHGTDSTHAPSASKNDDVATPVPDVVQPNLTAEQARSRALLESVVPFDQSRFSSEEGRLYLESSDRGLGELVSCSRALFKELALGGQVTGLDIRVQGRLKSLFSIRRKMLRKGLTSVADVYDARALRVIVDDIDGASLYDATLGCYKLENVVGRLWKPIHAEADDYIATPKQSGYRSLHVAVFAPANVPMEVQIRTESMHIEAEYGAAAHWQYKERAAVPASPRRRSVQRGHPVWRIDAKGIQDGVVIDTAADGAHLLVATSGERGFTDSMCAAPEQYQHLQQVVEERGYFSAGQGDGDVYLEHYTLCQDGKYHRVDAFGHKHKTIVVPLHRVADAMEQRGGSGAAVAGVGAAAASVVDEAVKAALMDVGAPVHLPPLEHLGLHTVPLPSASNSSSQEESPCSSPERSTDEATIASEAEQASHCARVNALRQTLEAKIGFDDDPESRRQRDKVLVMVWPTGEVRTVEQGTTAGHIIATQGEITISSDGRARRRNAKLVNVNNRLVPESTPLKSGDYVVLSREILDI